MDTLRGNFSAVDDDRDYDAGEDDTAREAPPAAIGTDERRMQVRAYNHWASQLEDRNFPSIDELDPQSLPDFGPYSVLLDFTAGIENPGVTYLGAELATECDISGETLRSLEDVPARSLLSRITDHYMQIIANQAPIGFEAEFVNQRGATILYRGILLPYSSDDETIDFIYGVINWKELADQHTSDELLLQVDQALESKPPTAPHRHDGGPMTDWADGPGANAANDGGDEVAETVSNDLAGVDGANAADDETPFDYAAKFGLNYDDDEEEDDEEEDDSGLPRPSFGSLTSIGGGLRKAERAPVLPEVSGEDYGFPEVDLADVKADLSAPPEGDFAAPGDSHEEPEPDSATPDTWNTDHAVAASVPAQARDALATVEDSALLGPDPVAEVELPAIAPDAMELGDWLAAAREMAAAARTNEDRTRNALYEAIGRAYDFSLAAQERPEDYEELVTDAGLTVQDRAPMTPVVKLVFGADYDKTRLTEYAAALSHAHRLVLPRGALSDYLRSADGGLKSVVAAERRMRKVESGKDVGVDPREALAEKLRAMPAVDFSQIDPSGAEFALVMIRRDENGGVTLLGEVPEDVTLLERAAKKLVG